MIKKIWDWWADYRQSILILGACLITIGALYLYKLGSLVPGNSLFEQPGFLGIDSRQAIMQNIAFAPLKVGQAIMVKIDDPNATLLRLLSVAVVFVAVLALYFILERWHTRRIALMGTALFASSSLVLHLGRFAGHEVVYLCIVPLILVSGVWLRSKKHVTKLPLAFLLCALILYIPGTIMLILPLSILFRKRLLLAWKFVSPRLRLMGAFSFLAAIAPIFYCIIRYKDQMAAFIGVDRLIEQGLTPVLGQFAEIPKQLLWSGPSQPMSWLVGTPILDIATIVLIVLGSYSYGRGRHPLRARLLLMLLILSVVVVMLSVFASVALLLPILYILAANGLAYLLQSWFTVFPRNPAARGLGIALLVTVVCFVALYHTRRYFIAWPNAPETKQALQTKAN